MMKKAVRLLIVFIQVCILVLGGGTPASSTAMPDTMRVSTFQYHSHLLRKSAQWTTSHPSASLTELTRAIDWKSLAEPPATSRDSIYWVRFVVHNDLADSVLLHIFSGGFSDQVEMYWTLDDLASPPNYAKVGEIVSTYQTPLSYSQHVVPVVLANGQTAIFYARFQSEYIGPPSLSVHLQTKLVDYHNNWETAIGKRNAAFVSIFVWSALLAILLFVIFLNINARARIYQYYALYLAGILIYFSLKIDLFFNIGQIVTAWPRLSSAINEPIQLAYMSFYILFSTLLLRIGQYDPRFTTYLQRFAQLLLGYSFLCFVAGLLVNRHEFDRQLLIVNRVVLLSAHVIILVRIIQKNRSPLLRYFLAGNFFFILGVVFSTVGTYIMYQFNTYGSLAPINYFQLGVFAEIMCFSFALGRNVQLLQQEKVENQEAFIQQLSINQELIERSNTDLQEKLEERTKEILSMTEALQEQKEANLRSEFEVQLASMEMQALRAQMNPHFIFNSLNTIRYFVLNNENDKASDYLGKFSRLLRMVLQNSQENTISLSTELEALRLYLDIEARRFGDSFTYEIHLPEYLDADGIIVPPLLLQPFAENAIWHGLLHSEAHEKHLLVAISENDDHYLFRIEDNGIGRERAAALKSKSAHRGKSFGMQITNKRIELFNKNFASQIQITVEDVLTPEGDCGGTRVLIRYQIPA